MHQHPRPAEDRETATSRPARAAELSSGPRAVVLELQRSAGNRAVAGLLGERHVQRDPEDDVEDEGTEETEDQEPAAAKPAEAADGPAPGVDARAVTGVAGVPGLPGPAGPPPGAPGGPGPLPPIPGDTPFNPNFGRPPVVPPSPGPGPGPVAAAPAAGAGLGLAGAGVAVAGFVAGVFGPALVGWALGHADEVDSQTDPDERSLPGGAPPAETAGADGDAGVPQQLPGPGGQAPATDPATGLPQVAPGQPAVPAVDPATGLPVVAPGLPADPASAGDRQGPVPPIPFGPPPAKYANIAEKAPTATKGTVKIGKKTVKPTVTIDGQTYVGGEQFTNREVRVPLVNEAGDPTTYQEFDVNPFQPGVDRGGERVLIGTNGTSITHFYTTDHYGTFTQF